MELALSLGGNTNNNKSNDNNNILKHKLCMSTKSTAEIEHQDHDKMITDDHDDHDDDRTVENWKIEKMGSSSSSDPTADVSPRQLDFLPFSPLSRPITTQPLRFPWLSNNLSPEPGSSEGPGLKIMEVSRQPAVGITMEDRDEHSSPNSGGGGATTSRGSDDEENGSTRKKLRLSKEQSAFLEESFKEHHTLNPKQKQALAKELNLRPRQVEVWFQNRRARTKLKQTEVDCEYLKRCCETLTEENRRLQKELHELRALKSSQPFFMHHPATTLTMCPSCERVGPTTSTSPAPATATTTIVTKPVALMISQTSDNSKLDSGITLSLGKPNPMVPVPSNTPQAPHQSDS